MPPISPRLTGAECIIASLAWGNAGALQAVKERGRWKEVAATPP